MARALAAAVMSVGVMGFAIALMPASGKADAQVGTCDADTAMDAFPTYVVAPAYVNVTVAFSITCASEEQAPPPPVGQAAPRVALSGTVTISDTLPSPAEMVEASMPTSMTISERGWLWTLDRIPSRPVSFTYRVYFPPFPPWNYRANGVSSGARLHARSDSGAEVTATFPIPQVAVGHPSTTPTFTPIPSLTPSRTPTSPPRTVTSTPAPLWAQVFVPFASNQAR